MSQIHRAVHGIAHFEVGQLVGELGQELVGYRFNGNQPLGSDAGLAVVVHSAHDGPFDGLVDVGIFQDDEHIVAAQFQDRLLESPEQNTPTCHRNDYK